jgi:hypothetical protein
VVTGEMQFVLIAKNIEKTMLIILKITALSAKRKGFANQKESAKPD